MSPVYSTFCGSMFSNLFYVCCSCIVEILIIIDHGNTLRQESLQCF